jgi:hypothetical protein
MKTVKPFFYCITAVVCLIACNGSKAKKIPVNSMKKIMWDMVCADELYAEAVAKDSTLKKKKENIRLYEQVFAANKISREAFYSSYRFYQEHPDELKVLIDSVQSYGSMQKAKPLKPALQKP